MKIHRLPASDPKKFGPKRVQSRRQRTLEKHGQLNLFSSGKVLRLHPSSSFEEALMLDEKDDLKGAREAYLKAIEAGESVADAYCNLGIIASKEDDKIEAIDFLTLSLKQDHRHFEAHFNLANIYAELGNLPLAKVHYQLAITIEPGFSNSYYNLGLTLVMSHEYEEAAKRLKTYVQLAPESERVVAQELIDKLSGL